MKDFEHAYKRLNAEQKKAVDTIEGPVMVVAGPGTGKTEVLTMRIANILRTAKIKPQRILALTFTESGVASMRRRLTDLIGTPAYEVAISTFHGFANTIIREYPNKFPNIIGGTSITEIDQVRILREIIDATQLKELKPFGDPFYYLKSVLSSINELKRQGATPEALAEIIDGEKKSFETIDDLYYEKGAHKGKMKGKYKERLEQIDRNGELAIIYGKYQTALRKEKHYDYSDMIMEVSRALENDESLLIAVQEAYDYFLVDEHQDTNDAQNAIIERIAGGKENPNLFVVGDEKQAIFRFQGASLANFYHFKDLYKNATLIPLRENYRSTQNILDAAHAISPRETLLQAMAGHPEIPVNFGAFSSPDAEYFFIAKKAQELIANGAKPEEIAVLYRENREAGPLARMLEKLAIPFTIESDQDVLADEDIQKLMRILNAIEHFGSPIELATLLHVDFLDFKSLDIYKFFLYAARTRKRAYDVMYSPSELQNAEIEEPQRFLDFFNKLSAWKKDTENRGALDAFESIVRDSGFLAALVNRPSATEKIAKLHALFEHLKSLVENRKDYTLKDFFAHLALIREQDVTIKTNGITNVPGKIRLMTAHKSKGQEFEYVFIMNAVDGKWGGGRQRSGHIELPRKIYRNTKIVPDDTENEVVENDDSDARNLFYVALTRAKKAIYLTMSLRNRDGRDQVSSQFIREIPENLVSLFDTASYEVAFANHGDIDFAPKPVVLPDTRDKEFLNARFAEQGLSVTALDNYLACPWKYFYVNLIRVPEAPTKHLTYGNAIHEAMKHYFDLRAKGNDPGEKYLIERFEDALAHQPINEHDFEEALQKGRVALTMWYDTYHATWIRNTLNEFRIADIQLEPETKINGKLDKIEILGDGNLVNVADYKTGKPKSRNAIEGKTKSSDGNYKRQLVFYRLLLDKQGEYAMRSGDIDFVEPDDNGKFHKEHFDISTDEVDELVKVILQVSNDIRTLAFWDSYCDDKECEYCDLRRTTV